MVRAGAGHAVTGVYTQLQIGLDDRMDSINKNSGALKVVGGMGVSSNVNVGGSMIVDGDLTVLGTHTLFDTVHITTDNKNITMGNTDTPTDELALGGGLILKGDTDKTIIWGLNPTGNVVNDAWNFDNDINLKSGKTYNINDVVVLTNDTLGSTVLNSSLTGVGSLSSGSISENFGDINIGTNKFTGGNLVIKSSGSDVFNLNSSSGITQSIKSSLSNSTTVTGFNQTQLDDSNLLKVNKTFTGDQTSENISKAVIFSSTFDSTLNKNKNNTLYVDSTHSGISTTGGTFHHHNKTTQNFAGTFNATHNTESRLSSYGINATSTTQQLGYNIGGFFEASNAGFENSGVIAVGTGSNSVNVGVFGTVDQTRDQIGTYMKSTLYDSLSGIKAGVFGYNPSTSANNYALYTSGYNYLGGNTSFNGTLSVSGISKFYSNISLDNSSITHTDGTDTYSTGIKSSKLTISNDTSDVLTISNNGQVKINTATNATSSTTGALVVTGGVGVGGDLHVSGIIKAANGTAGTIVIGDSSNNDNVEINAELASDIIPDVSTSHDLGSSTKQWKDLYVDGVSNLDQTNINTTDGNFNVTGSGITDIDTDADFSGNVIFSKGYSEDAVEVQGGLKLSQNNSSVILKAPTATGNVTYTLPNSYGSPNQVLTDNGSGDLYWSSAQDATNVGSSGYSIFKQTNNNVLEFKKIDAGTNVSITDADDIITINVGKGDNTLIEGNLNIQKQLSVENATILKSTLSVGGVTDLKSTLSVAEATTLTSTLSVGDSTTLNGLTSTTGQFTTTLGADGAVTFDTTLSVGTNTALTGTLSVGGVTDLKSTLSVAEATTLTSTLSVGDSTTLNGLTSTTGQFTTTLGADGAVTFDTTLSVGTNTALTGSLSVGGVTDLKSTLSVAEATTLTSTLSIANATTLESTLSVGENVTFAKDLTIGGDVTVSGDLNVSGATVTVSSDNLNITDPILLIGSSSSTNSDQGIIADRTSATNVGMIWNETNKEFTYIYTENTGTVSGNVSLKTTDGIDGYADLHSGNLTVEKELTFNNTTKNQINLPTNTYDALVIQKDDINKYMTFSTNTTSGKKIYLHKELSAGGVLVTGSYFVLTGGSINNIPIGDTTRSSGKFTTLSSTGSSTINTTLSVGTNTILTDSLSIGGVTDLKSTLSVAEATTLTSTLSVGDSTTLNGLTSTTGQFTTTLGADGAVTFDTTLSVGTNTSLTGTLSVGGVTDLKSTLSVAEATTLENTLSVGDSTTLNGLTSTTGQFTTTLGVDGAVTFDTTLSVGTNTTLSGSLSISGTTKLASLNATAGQFTNTLDVDGAVTLDTSLSVGTNSTLSGSLSVSNSTTLKSTLSIGGDTTISGTLSVGNIMKIHGQLDLSGNTNGLILPKGTTAEQINDIGCIRYNTDLNIFEGYYENGSNDYWGSLGGIRSSDGGTIIDINENNSGDTLRFYIDNSSGNPKMTLTSTELSIGVNTVVNGSLTCDTVDINGGTIDGTTISTTDITVGTGKTLNVSSGTLTTSATQNKTIIEGAASNIDIGSYSLTAQTLVSDVATGTAPLTVSSSTKVNNLHASQVTGSVDVSGGTLTLADNQISGDKVEGGTIASITISQLGGAMDCNNENITNVDIDSGSIDNTIIGGTTAAAGSFTNLNTSGRGNIGSTLSVESATTIKTTLSVGGASKIDGQLDLSGDTGGLILPKGTTAQQVDTIGSVRYNTDLNIFEGYYDNGSSDYWGSLGGIRSSDGDTKISITESTNDTMKFFVDNSSTHIMELTSSLLSISVATELNNTLDVTGATTLDTTLSVGTNSTLTGTLSIGNNSILSGSLSIGNTTNLKSTLSVAESTRLKSTLNVEKSTTLHSTLSVAGDITVGEDGTGHLFTIHSDTPSANIIYDNVNSKLIINGKSNFDALVIPNGNLVLNDNLSVGEISTLKDINTSGNVIVTNNISIGGTTNINNLEVQSLDVIEDFITIGLNNTNNSDANGGGIKLKAGSGADKTLLYSNTNDIWESSLGISLNTGNSYKINNVDVLNATTLGSSIVSSSLTSVGALDSGSISSNFGDINIGTNQFTTTGTASFGTMSVDQINLNNSTISLTGGSEDNILSIPDNLLEAFSIREGTNKYIDIKTTDGSEQINIHKNTVFSNDITGNNLKTGNVTIGENTINFGALINNLNKITIPNTMNESLQISTSTGNIMTFNTDENFIKFNNDIRMNQGNIIVNSDANGNNDVKFFGVTSNDYLLYDQSQNKLNLVNSSNSEALNVQGDATIDGDFDADGTIYLGDTGKTTYIRGDLVVQGSTTSATSTGTTFSDTTTHLDGIDVGGNSILAGNISITNYFMYGRESIASTATTFTLNNERILSEITVDTDNSSGTLDDGHTYGQVKRVLIIYVDGTKTFRLNITNFIHGSYIEFYNTGQSAELIWTQSRTSGINDSWCLVGGSGGLVVA